MAVHFHRSVTNQGSPQVLSLRCPVCRQQGVLESGFASDLRSSDSTMEPERLGIRRCPNDECRAMLFVIYSGGGQLLASYPPERLDFDPSGIPGNVAEALEEAVSCHSIGCHTAAAIMVRKTLEELCADQGAEGKTLKTRLQDLRAKGRVVLPEALFDGLDQLRLLGNDAAHLESHVYDEIGQEEVKVAIDFTKEVLKAVYQLEGLVDRLKGLAGKTRTADG